ncbi:hypothetical protein SEA_WEASELS2_56 [Rhodococcus phage Weasels2]|uniref:Uncharacterized protein n=1 Tax=Rhodococcus phage Weasels2 TaxID=1897437 RepID=A0A1I9SA40_9CAUD|nr:hypothetical protein FDH04_gp056 [Rhodococcus phage Weasels2]AOZ63646.1 hypothetical protein SEA_WEASELS2_56 [Rhodococcus phage Weasels2]
MSKEELKFSDILENIEDIVKIGFAVDAGKQRVKLVKWPVYLITSEFKINSSSYKSQEFERAINSNSAKKKAKRSIVADLIGKI